MSNSLLNFSKPSPASLVNTLTALPNFATGSADSSSNLAGTTFKKLPRAAPRVINGSDVTPTSILIPAANGVNPAPISDIFPDTKANLVKGVSS